MPANLILTDLADAPLAPIAIPETAPGAVSAPQAFRLLNDDSGGAVDEAVNPFLTPRQVITTQSEAVLRGARAVDERWLEIRATGTSTATKPQASTGWSPWGAGRPFTTTPLLGGEYHQLEVRYAPPGTAPAGAIDFTIDADSDGRETVLELGHTETSSDGVISGIGDGYVADLLAATTPTEQAPAAAGITLSDLFWIHAGVPYSQLTADLAIDENDGSAQPLGAGEAYWFRLSLAAGTLTATKGDKEAAPLSTATLPAIPEGEEAYAYVERGQGNILDAAITFDGQLGRFELTQTGSLQIQIGTGRSRIDNRLITVTTPTLVAMTASSTNTVYLIPSADGAVANTTDGSRPNPRAIPIWEVDTDGVSITATRDLRHIIGAELVSIDIGAVRFDEGGALGGVTTDQTTDLAVGDHLQIGSVADQSGGITLTGGGGTGSGIFTIPAGLRTSFDVEINATFTNANGTATIQWYDLEAATFIGFAAIISPTSSTNDTLQHGKAIAILEKEVETTVELRISFVSGLVSFDIDSYVNATAVGLVEPMDQASFDRILASELFSASQPGAIDSVIVAVFEGAAGTPVPTVGEIRFDLEYSSADGTTWTSIYTSQATDDRRPVWVAGGAPIVAGGLHEITVIPSGRFVRLEPEVITAVDQPVSYGGLVKLEIP